MGVIEDNLNLIIKIQNFNNNVLQYLKATQANYPNMHCKDARLIIFGRTIQIVEQIQLSLFNIQYNLVEPDWWTTIGQNISHKKQFDLVNDCIGFSKMIFFQSIFASTENFLRIILRTFDPLACKSGTGPFENIYTNLFSKLNIRHYSPFMDLMRCVRNTVHNNGVYFHKSGLDSIVVYKGTNYDFKISKSVDFLSWDFAIHLSNETLEMVNEIINHNDIKPHPTIIDLSVPLIEFESTSPEIVFSNLTQKPLPNTIINLQGVSFKEGFYYGYFKYEMQRVELFSFIKSLPAGQASRSYDDSVLPTEYTNIEEDMNIHSYEQKMSFWDIKSIESKDCYECWKFPVLHKLIYDNNSNSVFHKMERIK
jgi:hypothetical protein